MTEGPRQFIRGLGGGRGGQAQPSPLVVAGRQVLARVRATLWDSPVEREHIAGRPGCGMRPGSPGSRARDALGDALGSMGKKCGGKGP